MSTPNHLGRHTFALPRAHERHPLWLGRFRPIERRGLIGEDRYARNHVAGLLFAVMGAGLLLMAATVWWCW
jgi:hypothetical protein